MQRINLTKLDILFEKLEAITEVLSLAWNDKIQWNLCGVFFFNYYITLLLLKNLRYIFIAHMANCDTK